MTAPNYIFKESEDAWSLNFVGDFDAKYQAEVDPWEQSGQSGVRAKYYAYSRRKLLSRLRARLNSKAKGLEIGSGFGYLTQMLSQSYDMVGLDISETAIDRARVLHPGIEFIRDDICAEDFIPPHAPIGTVADELPTEDGVKTKPVLVDQRFHFLILAQCWWYILHELNLALGNCLACLRPGGLLVITQSFLANQRYGKDIADGFDGTIKLLMNYPGLRLVECHYDDTGMLCFHDGLIILRKTSDD